MYTQPSKPNKVGRKSFLCFNISSFYMDYCSFFFIFSFFVLFLSKLVAVRIPNNTFFHSTLHFRWNIDPSTNRVREGSESEQMRKQKPISNMSMNCKIPFAHLLLKSFSGGHFYDTTQFVCTHFHSLCLCFSLSLICSCSIYAHKSVSKSRLHEPTMWFQDFNNQTTYSIIEQT